MRLAIIALMLGMLASTAAWAGDDEKTEDTPSITVNTTFGQFGFESTPTVANGKCEVISTLDRSVFVDAFPRIQKFQLMNEDITQTQLNLRPNTLAMSFIMQLMPVAVKEVYDNHKDADVCIFKEKMKITNDYGKDEVVDIASFKFTRALNDKINWDKFQSQNLLKVAPNFSFSPTIMAAVQSEMGQ